MKATSLSYLAASATLDRITKQQIEFRESLIAYNKSVIKRLKLKNKQLKKELRA